MSILPLSELPSSIFHLIAISFIHLAAWAYCITIKGFVIDDQEGVAKFSDRFLIYKDQQGNFIKEEKVDSYEASKDKEGKPLMVKHTAWNPHLPFPDNLMRWSRLLWGRTFKEIGKTAKGHPVYGWVQDARKHHALNVIIQWANLLLGYNFLSHLFGGQIALVSTLIFALHPCGVQTIAWISGINYLLSLMGSLLLFNAVFYLPNPYVLLPAVALCSVLSCMTLLPGCLNFIILLMLGYNDAAIISGLIGAYFMLKLGRGTINYRVAAFKEQQMGKSTKVYWRKLIIMVKTVWYYARLILFPKRLGLFHTFGYHQEEPLDYADREFWAGLICIAAYGAVLYLAPDPVRFGLIWAIIYYLIFCNFITANQFVSERYVFIPIFGLSIAAAYYLQAYPIILAFLLGIYIMRVWVHLPTFKNEVRFYESNFFNFPNSEVAMGNLGVAYLNHGMRYKAYDTWHEATRQNAIYDVPWYNLYSLAKQNGDILMAKEFLQKCLDSPTIHFPELWNKEMEEINQIIQQNSTNKRIVI